MQSFLRKSIFGWFLIFPFLLSGQAPDLDSLLVTWQDESQSDSIRTRAYNTYVEVGFLYSRPDTVPALANSLIDFGNDRGYLQAKAAGYRLKGISNAMMGNYSESIGFFSDARETYEEAGNYPGVANSLKNIGNVYLYQGNRPRALEYAKKALVIYEDLGDKEGIAATLNNLGHIYWEQSNSERALEYGKKSLAIYEELGDKAAVAGRLSNLANIYFSQKNYELALETNQRALELNRELNNQMGVAQIYSNNGAIYFELGNTDEAYDYATKALDLHRKLGNKMAISSELVNLGFILIDQKKIRKALESCHEGLAMAEEIGAMKEQRKVCKCLYAGYKSQGNGNKALQYHEQMLSLEDSLQSEETANKLQQMEYEKQMLADSLKNEEEKLKTEMAYQEEVAEKEKSRNLFMAGGLILLILAGGLYSRNRYVRRAKARIEHEKDRSENLLLNILPAEIAEELKEKGEASARDFEKVSILFTDFKGFTQASEKLTAGELVQEINICFKAFDAIVEKYGVEKIKTIGDAYMAAGGLPVPDDTAAEKTVRAALEMQAFMIERKAERDAAGLPGFEMRVGIHTGHVVAGIVGVKKFQYDVWGDTVNTASRMESSGEVGKVNISDATYEQVKDVPGFRFESRGKVQAKGKGEMEMWFVF